MLVRMQMTAGWAREGLPTSRPVLRRFSSTFSSWQLLSASLPAFSFQNWVLVCIGVHSRLAFSTCTSSSGCQCHTKEVCTRLHSFITHCLQPHPSPSVSLW